MSKDNQTPVLKSAYLIIAILTLLVFVIECLMMVLFGYVFSVSKLWSSILDPVFLAILIFPFFYFLVYKPFKRHMIDKEKTNEYLQISLKELADHKYELEQYKAELEQKVKERNHELSKINEELTERDYFLQESQRVGNIGSYRTNFITGYWQSSETLDSIFAIDKSYDRSLAGWLEIVHPEDKQKLDDYLRLEVIAKQKRFDKEYRIIGIKDKLIKWVQGFGDVKFDNSGNITEMIGTIQDITDRKKAEEKLFLRVKELRDYQYAIDQSSTVEITDSEGKIVFANENFCKLSKYTLDELIGQDHRIMNSGYHPKSFFANLWDTIQSGKTFKGEVKNKAKDGSFFWVNSVIIPFLDENQKPHQYMIFREDITDRKQAEEALAESNEFNKQIIQNAQDGIIVYDRNLRYLVWNSFMEKFTGVPASQVLGKYPSEIFPFLEKTNVINNIKRALTGEIVITPDFNFHIPNSEIDGWALDTNSPLKNLKGEIIGVIGIVHDITERKQAEEALQKSERNLQAIFENTTIGFLLLDTDLNIRSFNKRGYDLTILAFGKKLEKNTNMLTTLPPERQQPFADKQRQVLQGKIFKYEVQYPQEAGSSVWLIINIRPIFNHTNLVGEILISITDITEIKIAEQKLAHHVKTLTEIANMQSHQVRAPIASLLGLISLFNFENPNDPMNAEILLKVETATRAFDKVIYDINQKISEIKPSRD